MDVGASGVSRYPQSPQNLAVGALVALHDGHVELRRVPHSAQNLRPGSLGVPQLGHITTGM